MHSTKASNRICTTPRITVRRHSLGYVESKPGDDLFLRNNPSFISSKLEQVKTDIKLGLFLELRKRKAFEGSLLMKTIKAIDYHILDEDERPKEYESNLGVHYNEDEDKFYLIQTGDVVLFEWSFAYVLRLRYPALYNYLLPALKCVYQFTGANIVNVPGEHEDLLSFEREFIESGICDDEEEEQKEIYQNNLIEFDFDAKVSKAFHSQKRVQDTHDRLSSSIMEYRDEYYSRRKWRLYNHEMKDTKFFMKLLQTAKEIHKKWNGQHAYMYFNFDDTTNYDDDFYPHHIMFSAFWDDCLERTVLSADIENKYQAGYVPQRFYLEIKKDGTVDNYINSICQFIGELKQLERYMYEQDEISRRKWDRLQSNTRYSSIFG